MLAFLSSLPWAGIGWGYAGLAFYILTSLANPQDESFASVWDVFLHKGKTVFTAALVVPLLVVMLQHYDQMTELGAFTAGFMNVSMVRKMAETWTGRNKLLGGTDK